MAERRRRLLRRESREKIRCNQLTGGGKMERTKVKVDQKDLVRRLKAAP